MGTTSTLRRFAAAFWRNTDSITKWIQVIALVLAAVWTIMTFEFGEAVFLKPIASVDGDLSWAPVEGSNDCYVTFDNTLKNVGKTAFDVNKVVIKIWRTPVPSSGTKLDSPSYLDFDKLETSSPFFEKAIPEGNLVRHFPPGVGSGQTFLWIFRSQSQSIHLFRADVFDSRGNSLGFGRQWKEGICVSK